MKIYIIGGCDMYGECHWIMTRAYRDKIDADKEAYWLGQSSMDEETGECNYYYVREVEVD